MGVVFRAYDPELSRHVALKLVQSGSVDLEHLATVEEYEQRLLRKAQALARLSHPNVVAAFDVGRFAGALFIAMELIDGVSLRSSLMQPRSRDEILSGDRDWQAAIDKPSSMRSTPPVRPPLPEPR